ncbi:MAG: gamma-glutamyl-phosphate reductase, partial [Clostridiales bacterium]|nr:gamma-glutamyl-phosphate reductase [Clostridiales bacterium]
MNYLETLGERAKKASSELIKLDKEKIDATLKLVAKLLRDEKEYLKTENAKDMENAKINGKSPAFLDRLALTDKVIDGVAEGVEQVAELESPVFKTVYEYENKAQGIV